MGASWGSHDALINRAVAEFEALLKRSFWGHTRWPQDIWNISWSLPSKNALISLLDIRNMLPFAWKLDAFILPKVCHVVYPVCLEHSGTPWATIWPSTHDPSLIQLSHTAIMQGHCSPQIHSSAHSHFTFPVVIVLLILSCQQMFYVYWFDMFSLHYWLCALAWCNYCML